MNAKWLRSKGTWEGLVLILIERTQKHVREKGKSLYRYTKMTPEETESESIVGIRCLSCTRKVAPQLIPLQDNNNP